VSSKMDALDDVMREHMAYLVLNEHKPFSYKDFMYFEVEGKCYTMGYGTFRNKISKMRQSGEVEIYTKSNPCFYTLKGYRFGKGNLMTDNHMEVITTQTLIHHPIYNIFESTTFGERTIHNLHLCFRVIGIYTYLSSNHKLHGEPIKKSKGISFPYFDIDKFTVIITIYPNDTCTVVIGCSENPVSLDVEGITRLSVALCRIEERLLQLLITSSINIPHYKEWTITLWHIGKDSLSEYSKEMFHCKWDLAEKIALRIYSKELQTNKNKVRIELQQNPRMSIEELQNAIMKKIFE
jgi:hypothetical protein